ncbi:hypothetical protein ACS5IN_011995 [Acinetobacter baumannii]|uniref:hypothetical protein n=1 Tax=Acinetobacter baumannii TaxID=470 RepID=UPI000E76B884|nr:hypothetical protein [Acinetobacter baumannii]RJN65293.1 hypothetical protein D3X67_19305 [Acinetobacter baumannii]
MQKYILKAEDQEITQEALELFQELGYELGESDRSGMIYAKDGEALCDRLEFWSYYRDTEHCKELTLPQLRDLVVLERNDVKDATHRDKRDESIYLTSDKVIYYWQGEWCKSAINKSNDYENYIANSLTPITQPQDPALISGADVPALIKKGESVQFRSVFNVQGGGEWKDLDLERDEEEFSLGDLINTRFEWRLKPQTIKLELELPKPFEPKVGDIYWFLSPFYSTGYDHCTFANDSSDKLHVQYGAYRSEDDVKKAVEQLRKIRGAS